MKTLAIETSCDETAVAILNRDNEVIASEIATQIDLHRVYGGVVPEVASRNHLIKMRPVLLKALDTASCGLADIDVFAATAGPGLAGARARAPCHNKSCRRRLGLPPPWPVVDR